MKTTLTILLAASLALGSCGWRESRINPSNWGQGRSADRADAATGNPLIPAERRKLFGRRDAADEDRSVLIASVTRLQIDRTPTGAIILAEGLASRQGGYDAELRPTSGDGEVVDGVLHLDFRLTYPEARTPIGSERTRRIVEAYSVSTQQLREVRQIQVRGAQNAMQSRRR